MNELQKKQLEILKAFIKVCEKHNLRYFAVGGTALGAIRHHGFIPWDDDIDVGMPVEDYEKFLELQDEFKGTPYFIQCWKSDPHYIYSFAKLRDSSTTFIENYYKNHRINHGVWIDVFPISGISDSTTDKNKCKPFLRKFIRQINLSYLGALTRKVHKRTFFKDILLNIVGGLFYLFNVNHYRQKKMDKMFKQYPLEKATLAGNFHFFWTGKVEGVNPAFFFDTISVPFEDTHINVVKRYDEYLTCLYGDYMTPPPEKQREGHHHYSGLDLEMGYEEYLKKHRI